MAAGKNTYTIEYEIDLDAITKEKLEEVRDSIVKNLMEASAGARWGGGCDHSSHDKGHCKASG